MDTSSNSNEYKHYQDCPTKVPFNRLNLLLLLCLVYHSESSSISVSGIKGGSVTLSCDFEDREILVISLNSQSENIPVCQEKNCSGRVFKEGSCDVIIKDLIFSDAGKYILIVYYNNDQREPKREILKYHLHIQDEISVKRGEELKMDVLLINADKVQHWTNRSTGQKEVWTRGHGVRSDRLNISDETLIINRFTVTDTGTYRVLDSEGEILITVTVTESKGNLKNTDEDKTDDSEHHSYWIVAVGLTVILVLTAVVLHKHLLRDYIQGVIRRRKEGLRSGDPEALKVYEDLCRGSV
ncbi:uncharacterized protein LOC127500693 isoform X12 [Ctenopharyngodon idella]|uniref:uncharacterized protein LOC127500693 isoform X12 n=1 Tax=Ctenopharyngodon idella TaxID=7959 RepID=UPI00223042F4|nr:uncharacterized protein LOC127500693 isoform X12 [Ctenopharyngodon idella]